MAFVQPVFIGQQAYVLRELLASKDRITLDRAKQSHADINNMIATMGHIVAWGQLRSAGRQGSALVDDLMDYAQGKSGKVSCWSHRMSLPSRPCWMPRILPVLRTKARFSAELIAASRSVGFEMSSWAHHFCWPARANRGARAAHFQVGAGCVPIHKGVCQKNKRMRQALMHPKKHSSGCQDRCCKCPIAIATVLGKFIGMRLSFVKEWLRRVRRTARIDPHCKHYSARQAYWAAKALRSTWRVTTYVLIFLARELGGACMAVRNLGFKKFEFAF